MDVDCWEEMISHLYVESKRDHKSQREEKERIRWFESAKLKIYLIF